MPTYAYTVLDPVPPVVGDPTTTYDTVAAGDFELLTYAETVLDGITPTTSTPATNYKLAFSTRPPTPHPSIGQLWPRGAGQA